MEFSFSSGGGNSLLIELINSPLSGFLGAILVIFVKSFVDKQLLQKRRRKELINRIIKNISLRLDLAFQASYNQFYCDVYATKHAYSEDENMKNTHIEISRSYSNKVQSMVDSAREANAETRSDFFSLTNEFKVKNANNILTLIDKALGARYKYSVDLRNMSREEFESFDYIKYGIDFSDKAGEAIKRLRHDIQEELKSAF